MGVRLPDLEQLSGLLERLEAATEGAAPPERREHSRTPAYDKVPVAVEVAGRPPVHGTLRDISRGGVGLTLPVPLPVGTALLFRSSTGAKSIRATCEVANCRPAGDGRRFIIGAKVVARLPDPGQPTPPVADAADPYCQPPAVGAADVDAGHVDAVRRRLDQIPPP